MREIEATRPIRAWGKNWVI